MYGADRWQTKLKDIPPPKANWKAHQHPLPNVTPRLPDLTHALPDIPAQPPASSLAEPETQVTALCNGIRVASEDAYQQVATIGVLVQNGLREETDEYSGVSFLLEMMAFKSSQKYSADELNDVLQRVGGVVSTFSDRETISYQIEVMREHVPLAVEILADTILVRAFHW